MDGPRWFLRGVISGPAAAAPSSPGSSMRSFADVVVVRGDYPAPPQGPARDQAAGRGQAALEEQMAAESGEQPPDPFDRGPEITETR